MKKKQTIFLIAIFCLIFLASCHGDKNKNEQANEPSPSQDVMIDYEIPESSNGIIIDVVPEN